MNRTTSSNDETRRTKLLNTLELPDLLQTNLDLLCEFLTNHHDVFSLEEDERGETDLVHMYIDTGDSSPGKQAPRQMPFAVWLEVAKQLKAMQWSGMITQSHSPWSSPVVIVRTKEGSHHFCIDYRGLNSITKADTFPLPRIDDLLDRLTLQRFMQQVLMGLTPEDGNNFVTAYINGILIFLPSLHNHLQHLHKVIDRLQEVNLKLKPMKCKLMRESVDYLGHVITATGLRTNPRLADAVREFPRPENVHDVRRFLGMTSYYWQFIPNFARAAQPLHRLTAKDVPFNWTADCEGAFVSLKTRLASPPVLAYPFFGDDFTLETDASIQGLGAILSQVQPDGKLHPVAYASRALNPCERNYSVSRLEMLAVVWTVTHFHSYL